MPSIFRSSSMVAAGLSLLLAGGVTSGVASAADIARAAVPPNPFATKAVDLQALARQRGGSDAASFADVKLSGAVTNNNASNLTTGSNIITDGALAGASGVPMVIQNSGNNVLIQSATIINVTVK